MSLRSIGTPPVQTHSSVGSLAKESPPQTTKSDASGRLAQHEVKQHRGFLATAAESFRSLVSSIRSHFGGKQQIELTSARRADSEIAKESRSLFAKEHGQVTGIKLNWHDNPTYSEQNVGRALDARSSLGSANQGGYSLASASEEGYSFASSADDGYRLAGAADQDDDNYIEPQPSGYEASSATSAASRGTGAAATQRIIYSKTENPELYETAKFAASEIGRHGVAAGKALQAAGLIDRRSDKLQSSHFEILKAISPESKARYEAALSSQLSQRESFQVNLKAADASFALASLTNPNLSIHSVINSNLFRSSDFAQDLIREQYDTALNREHQKAKAFSEEAPGAVVKRALPELLTKIIEHEFGSDSPDSPIYSKLSESGIDGRRASAVLDLYRSALSFESFNASRLADVTDRTIDQFAAIASNAADKAIQSFLSNENEYLEPGVS